MYGRVFVATCADGASAAAISVGADPDTPSLASKGDPEACPNEDAVLVRDDGRQVVLAVTDAHYGAESGHRVLELLGEALEQGVAVREVEALLRCIRTLRYAPGENPRQPASETTLLVAALDRETGAGSLVSFGDSSLTWVGAEGETRMNVKTPRFVTLARPDGLRPGWGHVSDFRVAQGGLLLAFTDGVDECHYGAPRTSIRGRHRVELFLEMGAEPQAYAQRLPDLALRASTDGPAERTTSPWRWQGPESGSATQEPTAARVRSRQRCRRSRRDRRCPAPAAPTPRRPRRPRPRSPSRRWSW